MAKVIVDPSRFMLQAAVVDWLTLAAYRGPDAVAAVEASAHQMVVQLRWMVSQEIGMPTEPFEVWRRPATIVDVAQPIPFVTTQLAIFGVEFIAWSGMLASVTVDCTVSGSGALLAGFVGPPDIRQITSLVQADVGHQIVTVTGAGLSGIILFGQVGVNAVTGVTLADVAKASAWQVTELVGLPVDPAQWADVDRWNADQGLVANLGSPKAAALARLERGAPPFGWYPQLAADMAAPIWQAPDAHGLLSEIDTRVLGRLHDVLRLDAVDQVLHAIGFAVSPPQNDLGRSGGGGGSSTASIPPLGLVLIGAATDPFLSLALGFGTAFDVTTFGTTTGASGVFDYMVIGHWGRGLSVNDPTPVDFAAIALQPPAATGPPGPANLAAEQLGWGQPGSVDVGWIATVQASWDRLPASGLLQGGSFAAARTPLSPAGSVEALLEKRDSGGFRPIAAASSAKDPETWRIKAVDRHLPIPPPLTQSTARYAAAAQDLFGLWSQWSTTDLTVAEPDPLTPAILSLTLIATVPQSGTVCPAILTVDLSWDWTDRGPLSFQLVGRLWAAGKRGQTPPDQSVPNRLERSVGDVSSAALTLSFAGDTLSGPGGVRVEYLDPDGLKQVAAGAAQGTGARRYRVQVPGYSLDYAATGHVGCVVWARAQQRVGPQRITGFSSMAVVDASDPIPKVVTNLDIVQLTSLPDAAGEGHAYLSWSADAGAAGYFVHEASETALRALVGVGQPDPSLTLSQRATALKALFTDSALIPVPRWQQAFHRINATALTVTSVDVTLPRGTGDIHCYVVISVSPGQIESSFPTNNDLAARVIPYAVPIVVVPASPTIEARRVAVPAATPFFAAEVAVTTRPGPRVTRIDLHRVRVDDAARDATNMGPPVASVTAGDATWAVTPRDPADPTQGIGAVTGRDDVAGSWRNVWYRAVAWSDPDPLRGRLGGRSAASSATVLVVPPPGPPDLNLVGVEWAGGPLSDVLVRVSSTAPVADTALGAHVMSVDAQLAAAPITDVPLLAVRSALSLLATAPPALTASGLFRIAGSAAANEYRVLLRRPVDGNGQPVAVSVAVRLTDPLGRTSEVLVALPAGPVDPAPDLRDVHVVNDNHLGVVLVFVSATQLTPTLQGPYRLRIEAQPIAGHKGPPGPPRPPGPFPSIAIPPGPASAPIGPVVGVRGLIGLGPPGPAPIVIDSPLGSIPVQQGSDPFGTAPLAVVRAGFGGSRPYAAHANVDVSAFDVRITGPDGRFAHASVAVN